MPDSHQIASLNSVDGFVQFTERPSLVRVGARTPWRLAVVCLILSRFRGQSARVEHVHLLNWAITTSKSRAQLRVWLSGQRQMDSATARVDPALEVTLSLARAEGLISVTSTHKVALTDLGKSLVVELDVSQAMVVEREYLASLGQLTEAGLRRSLGALAE